MTFAYAVCPFCLQPGEMPSKAKGGLECNNLQCRVLVFLPSAPEVLCPHHGHDPCDCAHKKTAIANQVKGGKA